MRRNTGLFLNLDWKGLLAGLGQDGLAAGECGKRGRMVPGGPDRSTRVFEFSLPLVA